MLTRLLNIVSNFFTGENSFFIFLVVFLGITLGGVLLVRYAFHLIFNRAED